MKTTRSGEETPLAFAPDSSRADDGIESVAKAQASPDQTKRGIAVVPELTRDMDEDLIADERADLTPAQMVERKLISLLKGKLLPVSHVRMTNLPRHWGQ